MNWRGSGRSGRGLVEADPWRKNTKPLSQDSQCPDRDLNRALSEYKSKVLPLDQFVLWIEPSEYYGPGNVDLSWVTAYLLLGRMHFFDMKITLFWDVMACGLVDRYQHLLFCPEDGRSTLLRNVYTTFRHIPEDSNLHDHKSHFFDVLLHDSVTNFVSMRRPAAPVCVTRCTPLNFNNNNCLCVFLSVCDVIDWLFFSLLFSFDVL
jgi:hypothetical protein